MFYVLFYHIYKYRLQNQRTRFALALFGWFVFFMGGGLSLMFSGIFAYQARASIWQSALFPILFAAGGTTMLALIARYLAKQVPQQEIDRTVQSWANWYEGPLRSATWRSVIIAVRSGDRATLVRWCATVASCYLLAYGLALGTGALLLATDHPSTAWIGWTVAACYVIGLPVVLMIVVVRRVMAVPAVGSDQPA
jgi:hypothetical protein